MRGEERRTKPAINSEIHSSLGAGRVEVAPEENMVFAA